MLPNVEDQVVTTAEKGGKCSRSHRVGLGRRPSCTDRPLPGVQHKTITIHGSLTYPSVSTTPPNSVIVSRRFYVQGNSTRVIPMDCRIIEVKSWGLCFRSGPARVGAQGVQTKPGDEETQTPFHSRRIYVTL